MIVRTASKTPISTTQETLIVTWLTIAVLCMAASKGMSATLMSFTQRDSSQYLRFNDIGATTSTLTTWDGTTLGVSMDVDFTFLAANRYYSSGTTVQAKFNFTADVSGTYGSFGSFPSVTRLQAVKNVVFSFKSTDGTVNFLSGTSDDVFLTQMASNTAFMDIDFGGSNIFLTSDAFNVNGASDSTQMLSLDFSPLTPSTFGDANHDTVLDTVNMNVTGNATAVAGPVPEPGSALLVLVGTMTALRRRR